MPSDDDLGPGSDVEWMWGEDDRASSTAPPASDDISDTSSSIPPLPSKIQKSMSPTLSRVKAKPNLKSVPSTIRKALDFASEVGDPKIGLLKFFSKGTQEDTKAYWAREEEIAIAARSKEKFQDQVVGMEKKVHDRELARVRQQRRRQKLKEEEIQQGERSPGGRKRKV